MHYLFLMDTLVILLILVNVAFLITFARAQRKWCETRDQQLANAWNDGYRSRVSDELNTKD